MKNYNRCEVVTIHTPKKYILNGLWFGAEKPKKAVIFVHGLGATAFSNRELVVPLINSKTAVITFSNRGHDQVARIKKVDAREPKGYISETVGQSHEVFMDCVDDIQGMINFVSRRGAREIYLAGHSTGCQKITYFLAHTRKNKIIKGAVLLCPLSDYAIAKKFTDPKVLRRAEMLARKLVQRRLPHELLPVKIWPSLIDAQRFLSLYTPKSEEEIFSYVQPRKTPKTLRKLKIPLLIIFAGSDEYSDRDSKELVQWFKVNVKSKDIAFSVIEGAFHSFQGYAHKVVREMNQWIRR